VDLGRCGCPPVVTLMHLGIRGHRHLLHLRVAIAASSRGSRSIPPRRKFTMSPKRTASKRKPADEDDDVETASSDGGDVGSQPARKKKTKEPVKPVSRSGRVPPGPC
jgi:hypothetical protein